MSVEEKMREQATRAEMGRPVFMSKAQREAGAVKAKRQRAAGCQTQQGRRLVESGTIAGLDHVQDLALVDDLDAEFVKLRR